VPNILGPLSPLVKSWHLSEVDSPRAIPLETLRILAESCRLPEVHVHPSVTEAYREAASRAGRKGTVVVFGSVFAVGEFLLHQSERLESNQEQTPPV